MDRESTIKGLNKLYCELGQSMEEQPSGITEGLMRTIRSAKETLERDEKGLQAAWDALKWKRINPLDQIDEARDIIDDTLERPRINGVKAKLGTPTSRYR